MLTKRIIPCLDIKDGRTVKGVNFVGLQDAGDPVELAIKYVNEGADELVFLDISATNEKRKTLASLVTKIAENINIPFTVGGGINSVEDAITIIEAGADKISINSSAVNNPNLITLIAKRFGSQCVVTAIDIKYVNNKWIVFTNGGKKQTQYDAIEWSKKVESFGAGEILLTSMDNDGVKTGYALEILNSIANLVTIPVIASGGAGNKEHFLDVFSKTTVSAALAASIFHYNETSISEIKKFLTANNINVR